MFDNFLPKALFISLTLHTVFVCSSLVWHMPHVERVAKANKAKTIEITYKAQVAKKAPDVREHPIKPAQQLDLKNTKVLPADGTVPLKLAKENQNVARNFKMYERKPEQIRSMQSMRRVSVVPIKSEKINNPAYAAYNEMVRNRIEEKVYANFSKMEGGVVYLTFIIVADGSLKASQIIQDKSNATQNLKDISMKSLQEARFPPFLKGMTLPEYTFNIEVQYQVRD